MRFYQYSCLTTSLSFKSFFFFSVNLRWKKVLLHILLLLISIWQIDTKSVANFSLFLSKVCKPKERLEANLIHVLIIIIIMMFVSTSTFHVCVGRMISYEVLPAFISLAMSLLTSVSFRSLPIILFHIFVVRSLLFIYLFIYFFYLFFHKHSRFRGHQGRLTPF